MRINPEEPRITKWCGAFSLSDTKSELGIMYITTPCDFGGLAISRPGRMHIPQFTETDIPFQNGSYVEIALLNNFSLHSLVIIQNYRYMCLQSFLLFSRYGLPHEEM